MTSKKETYQLIIKGETFKRLIINRTTTIITDGKEKTTIVEIYNEPINTFDLIKKIERVIKTNLKTGQYEISADNVNQFFS